MNNLEKAILMAFCAHSGQKRDDGEPYFCHIMRVCQNVLDTYDPKIKLSKEDCAIVGVLHDTLEDTEVSYADIKNTFGEVIASYVLILSRLPDPSGEKIPYLDFIREISKLPVTTLVKLADLKDNMRDRSNERYEKAVKILTGVE